MKTTTKNRIGKAFGIAALCLGLSTTVSAQCNLSFTANQTTAGQVNFTNTSTGLSGSPTYYWNFGYQNGTSTSASPSFTYPYNGTYTVSLSVTDSLSSCFTAYTQTVSITNTAATPPCGSSFTYTVGTSGQVSFTNTSVTYTASTNNYSWTFGDFSPSDTSTSPSHTYTYDSTYVVTLYVNNSVENCFTSSTQTVTITNALPIPSCNAAFTYTLGSAGLVTFSSNYTGSGGSNYAWYDNASNYSTAPSPAFTYTYNGTYTVTLSINDSLPHCFNSSSQIITITNATPPPCSAGSAFTMHQDSLTTGLWDINPNYFQGVTSAVWFWGDGTSTAGLYPTHTFPAAGMYSICVHTYAAACSDSAVTCQNDSVYKMTAMVQISVIDPTGATGIKAVSNENASLKLFPNPNNGQFTLNVEGLNANVTAITISVDNLIGQSVYQTRTGVANGKLLKEIDMKGTPDGIYFMKVNTGNKIYTIKTVISQ